MEDCNLYISLSSHTYFDRPIKLGLDELCDIPLDDIPLLETLAVLALLGIGGVQFLADDVSGDQGSPFDKVVTYQQVIT